MVKQFRKKPVVIEAVQWTGANIQEMKEFYPKSFCSPLRGNCMEIHTSEGVMTANEGDWIIKEPFDKERGFYPCKPDIFEQTYEEV